MRVAGLPARAYARRWGCGFSRSKNGTFHASRNHSRRRGPWLGRLRIAFRSRPRFADAHATEHDTEPGITACRRGSAHFPRSVLPYPLLRLGAAYRKLQRHLHTRPLSAADGSRPAVGTDFCGRRHRRRFSPRGDLRSKSCLCRVAARAAAQAQQGRTEAPSGSARRSSRSPGSSARPCRRASAGRSTARVLAFPFAGPTTFPAARLRRSKTLSRGPRVHRLA